MKNKAAILLIIVSLAILASCRDRFGNEPNEYYLSGHTFLIPDNYLGVYPENSMTDHLELNVKMPGFEARTPQNIASIKNGDMITIQIWPATEKLLEVDNDQYLKNSLKIKMNSKIDKWANPKKLDNGLIYIEATDGQGWLRDYYLEKDSGKYIFILDCFSELEGHTPPVPLCSSDTLILNDLKLTYWYPQKYLPQAQEIHKNIMNLILGFEKAQQKK